MFCKWLMFCKGNVALSLNHFWPIFPFYTPWKHQRFFGVFRVYKMWTLARNGLNNTLIMADMNKVQKTCTYSNNLYFVKIILTSSYELSKNQHFRSPEKCHRPSFSPNPTSTPTIIWIIWNLKLFEISLSGIRQKIFKSPPPGGSPLSEPSQTSKMDLFVQIVNGFFICIPFRSQVKSQH